MAITTNASYAPTLSEFVGHWTDVNEVRADNSQGALVLNTGLAVAGLAGLRTDLLGIEGELQARLNDAQIARGEINSGKAALAAWGRRFLEVFDASFGSSPWANARPSLEAVGTTTENFVRPLLDILDLWQRINALTGLNIPPGLTVPLVLLGAEEGETLTVEEFETLIAGTRTAADAEAVAEGRVKRARSQRTFTQEKAYAAMKLYRQAMPPALPSGDPLQATLPRLTPADTGATPEPVAASAVYVSGSQSKTVYEASTAENLREYQLRGVVGEEWDEDDAVTIATNGPGVAREFVVNFGLTQPGTKIVLKVYVVTETGRERGSAPMVVARG